MYSFASPIHEIQILDPETKEPISSYDHDRRFFEAAWMHKYQRKYYFSPSIGDTYFLCYATETNPRGPFVYRERVLELAVGWTTHYSIVEFERKWYLFYYDATLREGKNHLRCVKVKEIFYDMEGKIKLDP
jgi:hypothetical protein